MVLDKDRGMLGPTIPSQIRRFGQSAGALTLIRKHEGITRGPPNLG